MPGDASASLELPREFSLDTAIHHYFHKHPLYKAILWYYFFKQDQTDLILEFAMHGSMNRQDTRRINLKSRRRLVKPQDAPAMFWQYWILWMCPSFQQISQWRIDLVAHVVRIMQAWKGQYTDETIFNCGQELVSAMGKEFPQEDIFQRAYDSKWGSPLEMYQGILEKKGSQWQSTTTYTIDYDNPNKDGMFHVIELCVRLLSEFQQSRLHDMLKGTLPVRDVLFQVKRDAAAYPGLQFWPTVAGTLIIIPGDKLNLNRKMFWTDPYVLTLVNEPRAYPKVRELIQLMFVYSDVDPAIGLIPAIGEVNSTANGHTWKKELDIIGGLHTSVKPMMDNPWTRQDTVWENGVIDEVNYNLLKLLLSRVRPTLAADFEGDVPDPLQDKPEESNLLLYGAIGAAAVGAYALT